MSQKDTNPGPNPNHGSTSISQTCVSNKKNKSWPRTLPQIKTYFANTYFAKGNANPTPEPKLRIKMRFAKYGFTNMQFRAQTEPLICLFESQTCISRKWRSQRTRTYMSQQQFETAQLFRFAGFEISRSKRSSWHCCRRRSVNHRCRQHIERVTQIWPNRSQACNATVTF